MPSIQPAAASSTCPERSATCALFTAASEVRVGDTLCYGNPRSQVTIERLSVARCDGAIGMHAKGDTWACWYQPTDRVRVVRAGCAA